MKEVEPDNKWLNEPVELEVAQSLPNDAELLTVTLLARLYDVGMALLTHLDEKTANQVYEAHEKGENFNPPMFIPSLTHEE